MDLPKTQYVKKKLQGLNFNEKNRRYINVLLSLESVAAGKTLGWMTGYRIKSYETEYHAILKELDPKRFDRMKQEADAERKREKREDKKLKEQAKKELVKEKKLWVKYGGRL